MGYESEERPACEVEIDIRQYQAGESGSTRIELPLEQQQAVILYPALTCPAMVREGEPIRLLVAVPELFYQRHVHATDRIRDASGDFSSQGLIRTVSQHLKIRSFDSALDDKTEALTSDAPLTGTIDEANSRLTVHYLGPVQTGMLYTLYPQETFRGLLRQEIVEDCQQRGLTRIFEIRYYDHGLSAGKSGTLYDASWLVYRPKDGQATGYEPQDEWTAEFLERDRYMRDSDFKYEIDVEKETIDFTVRKDRPIRNYHPIWVGPKDKATLNVAHLTDVHVSSRQHAFRVVKPQLLPGKSPELGPLVNVSFDTLRDLMDQFGQDPEIDLLFFTGDLIDYNRNYNPTPYLKGEKRHTGELWQDMNLDNLNARTPQGQPLRDEDGRIRPNTRDYPRGIDNAVMYSLFLRFYRKYGKPIFLVSGNHEAYTVPYGISARVHLQDEVRKSDDSVEEATESSREFQERKRRSLIKGKPEKGFKRANPGMPADHNLTISEAILLFGPDFDRIILGENFSNRNFDWFYTVFSPITDFFFTWGRQCFIGLGWGDSEQFLAKPYSRGRWVSSFLPWATQSLTDRQLALLRSALDNKRECNILGTHFTVANYEPRIPISEEGEINFNDGLSHITKHAEGTFTENRKAFYRFLADNKLHVSLSGHSHRAGLYHIREVDDGWIRHNLKVKGQAADPNKKCYQSCEKGPNILVSASGGPIAGQNHHGELGGNGLDVPSGSYIQFNDRGKPGQIGIRPARNSQAKPRLAVALDYADLLGRDPDGVGPLFTTFEQKRAGEPFIIQVNPEHKLPPVHWIEAITLHVIQESDRASYLSEVTFDKSRNAHRMRLPASFKYKYNANEKISYYLEIQFTNNLLSHPGFSQYDTSTSWIWQVELIDRRQEAIDRLLYSIDMATEPVPAWVVEKHKKNILKTVSGLRVERHSQYGEIPDLVMYSKSFGEEYKYPWMDKMPGVKSRRK